MPLYEYYCSDCKSKFELLVSRQHADDIICMKCHSEKVRRLLSVFAVASNGIACAQKETSAVDPDVPILFHVGRKVPDYPDLASGWDASHFGICRTSGNIADPSPELDQVLGQRRLSNGSDDEHYGN